VTATAVARFTQRLHAEWLPTFCRDQRRNYDPAGFKDSSILVSEFDATNFLRALDSGLVVDSERRGRYRCEKSKANEQLFWEGSRKVTPRPLTLWMEPVITIATVARLHLDFGWAAALIGMQPSGWAFDFAAYAADGSDRMVVAGEVKKSRREVDSLVEDLEAYSRADEGIAASDDRRHVNSRRKWDALQHLRAPLLWVVGPDDYTLPFAVTYGGSQARLSRIAVADLEQQLMRATSPTRP
jgi:pimeloyl-ACP methyl ester carboxylesterase